MTEARWDARTLFGVRMEIHYIWMFGTNQHWESIFSATQSAECTE